MKNEMNQKSWSFPVSDDGVNDVQLGRRFIRMNQSSYGNSSDNSSAKGASSSSNSGSNNKSQVVLKITGHKHDAGGLKAHVDYITREKFKDAENISAENEKGEIIDKDVFDSYKDWITDHENRENSDSYRNNRVASAFMFSAPVGTNPDAILDSVREFASKNLSDHRYLFVLHSKKTNDYEGTETVKSKETDHPHVHLVIENISPHSNSRLITDPEILRKWRDDLVDIGASNGLEFENNISTKSKTAPHEKNQNIYRMLKKGQVPNKHKQYYETAKDRLKAGRVHPSQGENKFISDAISKHVERQKQISDLTEMVSNANSQKQMLEYSNEIIALKAINASTRMPMSDSQMLLKYALYKEKVKQGAEGSFNTSVPTVKHYMYGLKLGKAFDVDLPPAAHFDYQSLSKFINKFKDKPTPKYADFVNTVAKDRGHTLNSDVLGSHRKLREWLSNHQSDPTLKTVAYANKLAADFNVNLPDQLTASSIKSFINEYSNMPSKQMVDYANVVQKENGLELPDELLSNKTKLAQWINKSRQANVNHSDNLTSLIKTHNQSINDSYEIDISSMNNQLHKNEISKEIKNNILKLAEGGVLPNESDIKNNESARQFLKSHMPTVENENWTDFNQHIESVESSEKSKDHSSERNFDFDLDLDLD